LKDETKGWRCEARHQANSKEVLEMKVWSGIEKIVTAVVWVTDLQDVRYLSEKLLRGINRGFVQVEGERKNFFIISCDEAVYNWLYNEKEPERI
jgi:hypothetical protein